MEGGSKDHPRTNGGLFSEHGRTGRARLVRREDVRRKGSLHWKNAEWGLNLSNRVGDAPRELSGKPGRISGIKEMGGSPLNL